MDDRQPQSGSRQRIDKWLFFARVAKSRSLAQERVAAGHVSVNGQTIRQASHQLKSVIVSTSPCRSETSCSWSSSRGERRGPYEEARLLYEDLTPPAREKKPFTTLEQARRAPGAGRPTKEGASGLDELRGEPIGRAIRKFLRTDPN